MFGRTPASGEPELIAGLESARSALVRTEREASAAVAAARTEVVVAQSRVEVFRRGLLGTHAKAWREHAQPLRQQAETVGELETVTVAVQTVVGGLGSSVEPEPRLRFRRTVLGELAAAADAYAAWIEGYLARGRDGLDSATLQRMAAELEMPSEAAETVAA